MKKKGKYFKIAALLGIIGFVSFFSSRKQIDKAEAASVKGNEAVTLSKEAADIEASTGTAEQVTTVETKEENSVLYPSRIKVDGVTKYGYIDGAGKIVIQPIYSEAHNFSEGFAVVYNNDAYQMIDQKGNVIFKSDYPIYDFHNGMAAFWDPKKPYKKGYINTRGKVVIKPQYMNAGDFKADNTAVVEVKKGKFYLINNKGKVLKSYQVKANYNEFGDFDDGYIITNDPNTYLQGVVNLQGKVILKPVYGEVTYLGNNLFGVKKAPKQFTEYLIAIQPSAIYNVDGKRLTGYKFYDLSKFTGNYASATYSKTTYFINKKGIRVTSLPTMEGRGTMTVLGDIIQADIDNEIIYMKMDGTVIFKNDTTTKLSSGITVNTVKYKPNKYVVVNYPNVEGLGDTVVQKTINDKLKTIFTKYRKNLKESDYLSVYDTFIVEQIKDLLIINRNGYDYPFGAAHGQPLCDYYFINTKTGDFYQLKDLFKDNSDYVTKLSKIVKKQMKGKSQAEDGMYFVDNFKGISKEQKFYIGKDNLTIYFDCGDIAAYAAGFPKFVIPFKDIKDMINTDGAFWKAFQ